MDGFNLSWRGQPRSGKRKALHAALQSIADLRGIPFHIQMRQFHMQGAGKSENGQISTTVEDDSGDTGGSEKDCFPYEFSLLHIGFDIARMSMQDKIYLKPILQRWSTGSQVLAGNQGRGCRILVFYHAHLFSTESYFLLHSLLENNYGDVSLWFTSELPVADRLSDYFIEIPVANPTPFHSLPSPSWYAIFAKLLTSWSKRSYPKLGETNEIRAFLYELLMRNLRWTDCVHYLLDVVLTIPLDLEKQKKILSILAYQEATAAGQTIPSYRIPLLWENLFVDIREAISMNVTDGESSSNAEDTRGGSSTVIQTEPPSVDTGHSNTRRRTSAKTGSTRAKPVRSIKTA